MSCLLDVCSKKKRLYQREKDYLLIASSLRLHFASTSTRRFRWFRPLNLNTDRLYNVADWMADALSSRPQNSDDKKRFFLGRYPGRRPSPERVLRYLRNHGNGLMDKID